MPHVQLNFGAPCEKRTVCALPRRVLVPEALHPARRRLPGSHGSPLSDLSPLASKCHTRQATIGEMKSGTLTLWLVPVRAQVGAGRLAHWEETQVRPLEAPAVPRQSCEAVHLFASQLSLLRESRFGGEQITFECRKVSWRKNSSSHTQHFLTFPAMTKNGFPTRSSLRRAGGLVSCVSVIGVHAPAWNASSPVLVGRGTSEFDSFMNLHTLALEMPCLRAT